MGVKVVTFFSYLSRSGKELGKRWTIVKEGLCAEILDELNGKQKTIGQYMKLCRLKKEMPRTQLERLSGVATNCIRSYEKDYNYPSLMNLIAIADALNVSIDELIGRSRK
jgi:DNA-binding XRE family transcriptional regulator